MATIHHQSYHHSSSTTTATTSSRRHRRHSLDYSSLPSSSSTPLSSLRYSSVSNNISISSHLITFSLSSSTTTTSLNSWKNSSSLDLLERYLAEGNFRQADDETRRLLIVLAGEAAVKRGYVFFSEVQFIPTEELKAIDDLWRKFSDNRFGYSVQKKIWKKVNKDFTNFFKKVGWMKKLDTEVEQYNYRSFPNEFIWELNGNSENNNEEESSTNDDDSSSTTTNNEAPPEGHLPLTNALRGTQLLNMIFTHPAFDDDEDEDEGETKEGDDNDNQVVVNEVDKKKSRLASLRDRLFKPNYSF